MPLGWIDFSKSDQAKALDVLNNLSESGTLDELGVGPIRDWFSWYFFPGTSTIQTRAKYFFIVPYALMDLEKNEETDPKVITKRLDGIERDCAEMLLQENGGNNEGVIGRNPRGSWVKRTPATIYWSGLREFRIFGGNDPKLRQMSLQEYIRASCNMKKEKQRTRSPGRNTDRDRDPELDDPNAGMTYTRTFWSMKTYDPKWKNNLSMKLTQEEAEFLQDKIVNSPNDAVQNSMLAFLLQKKNSDLLSAFVTANSFHSDLVSKMPFPSEMRDTYDLAVRFSRMYYIIAAVYNQVVSQGKLDRANAVWNDFRSEPETYTDVDLEVLFAKADCNVRLRNFLVEAKRLLEAQDLEGMKRLVKSREVQLKGEARAKTMHPELYRSDSWHGIDRMQYRFPQAKRILGDIREGLPNG